MLTEFLNDMGLSLVHVVTGILVVQLIIIALLISSNIKYSRMKKNYATFVRGKDGMSLEASLLTKFAEIDKLTETTTKNSKDINDIYRKMRGHYQKVGIVKYDAFLELGGNLSFALTLLDQEDNGFIMNVMHSREGCYTYIKEIVKGESYVELAEEETESLERAIFQEEYAIRT
ncbi:MAG: DUF4446 family protein [Lachnospiraceae bacterium]|nr:DUF4446 family protein [Lachnospiraceae bacterium]